LFGETQEEPDPEPHHSVRSLLGSESEEDTQLEQMSQSEQERQTQEPETEERPSKPRVKWPRSSNHKSWKEFDQDVETTLEVISSGNIHKKIDTMTTLIYNMGIERFGEVERKQVRDKPRPNRREKERLQRSEGS
jgi:hypothetical protein